jgi:hypothetical protein
LGVFVPILTPGLFAEVAGQAGLSMGRGALNQAALTWLALSAALHPGLQFCQVLRNTFRLLRDIGRLPPAVASGGHRRARDRSRRGYRRPVSKHDPRRKAHQPPSEEAFSQARTLLPLGWWVALIVVLGRVFESRRRTAALPRVSPALPGRDLRHFEALETLGNALAAGNKRTPRRKPVW